jgi:NAD(P)-dependent dehydrogenase (short-subunit alcohol dehydrogenase family)
MDGKVFVVTGAASGIGRATTLRLAEMGAAGLAISDLDEAGLLGTKELCGCINVFLASGMEIDLSTGSSKYKTEITIMKVDVSKADQVDSWVEAAAKNFGRLDGAANVAGIALGQGEATENIVRVDTPIDSTVNLLTERRQNQQAWENMLSVNLTGTMLCMRAELKFLPQPGGAIVNVSSTSGLRGLPNNAAYASSKFGVIGLTESTAAEYGKKGVRVNAVVP